MSPRDPFVLAAAAAAADLCQESTTTTSSMGSSEELQDQCVANGSCMNQHMVDTELWLGGEPNLLSIEEEIAGVKQVLKSLSEDERSQLVSDDTTMPIRYLRGAKGDVEKAVFHLKKTLQWRRDFRVHEIIHSVENTAAAAADPKLRQQLWQEHETGGMYVRGYDVEGRAIICSHLGAPNTGDEEAQLRALVYMLEKAFACTARKSKEIGGKPLQKVIMLFDFDGYSRKHSYSISTLKKVNEILSYHYPERLTAVYLIRPPTVFNMVWQIIRPFIDPRTRQKYLFCNNDKDLQQLTSRVRDLGKLEPSFGGTNTNLRPYDSEEHLRLPFDECFDEYLEL